MRMKSVIRDTTVVNTGKKERTVLEIKKPYAVSQCNQFMNGVDRTEKFLSYYSYLRTTVKWP